MSGELKEKDDKTPEEAERSAGAGIGGAILGASLGGPIGAIVGGFVGLLLASGVNENKRKSKKQTGGK